MRKLIVGCGYLGKRIAREWISQGQQVFALTRSAERASELQMMGIEPLIGDVTEESVLRGVEPMETVLYSVGFDRHGGQSRQSVTVEGLRKTLESLSGKAARFLYTSTTSVYGIEDGGWVNAETICDPQGENGILALRAEENVRSHCQQSGITGTVIRLSGIYGRGRLLARQQGLLDGISPGGNPNAWLNLIHVEDAVRAILACESKGTAGATYLVSDNRPIPRREYYSLLARLIGAPEPRYEPTAEDLLKFNKRCDNQQTKDDLDWEPEFATIETGLPDAIQSG